MDVVPPHPELGRLKVCPHAACKRPWHNDDFHDDGTAPWRYSPNPVAMQQSCQTRAACIRKPHEDDWHLLSSASAFEPHNVWVH